MFFKYEYRYKTHTEMFYDHKAWSAISMKNMLTPR